MSATRLLSILLGVMGVAVITDSCDAAFHQWSIKEIFSNQDGSVQFIELFTSAPAESFLAGHRLEAISDGQVKTFILDRSLPAPTTNKHLLFATAGFSGLAGSVTPDFFPLPPRFFDPSATTIIIDWAFGFDAASISGHAVPTDGIHSLTDANLSFSGPDTFVIGVNSPTNFAGAAGSINLGIPEPGSRILALFAAVLIALWRPSL